MPDDAAALAARSTEGAILAIGPEGVVGWGWHRGRPAEPLRVVLSVAGNPVASGFANRFDLATVRAQVGPGAPGFALRLPQWPRGAYPLEIELRDGRGQRLGAPFQIHSAERLAQACDGARLPLEGSLDRLEAGRLLGWAWDPNHPEAAQEVELLDGGEVLARAWADLDREDLRAAGKRGGRCGFVFDLPASLIDGRAHSLRARVAGTSWEVANGPVAFGPSRIPQLLDEVARLEREMRRLSAQVEQLTRPDGALVRDIIGSLHERFAMMAEIQRDAVEREMDALRRLRFAPVPTPAFDGPEPETTPEATTKATTVADAPAGPGSNPESNPADDTSAVADGGSRGSIAAATSQPDRTPDGPRKPRNGARGQVLDAAPATLSITSGPTSGPNKGSTPRGNVRRGLARATRSPASAG